MRVRRALSAAGVAFDMTPMIDIVFLLLIFFMMASELTSLQSAGEVTLPEARQAQAPARVDRHRITVTILAQGTYLVTGEDKTLLELRQVLRSEVDAARTAGRSLPSVHVRADRAASYGRLRLVMRECVALGIRQMSFAAEPPAGEPLMPEEE